MIYGAIIIEQYVRGKQATNEPLVIPSMINMLRPAIAIHKKPKKAVIILE